MSKKVLEVLEITKKLSGEEVLHNVSFEVLEGEIYGFLGPNGAGKTTTMKCIMGLITPESGNIKVLGEEGLTIEGKNKVGFMPENTYLYKYLTGREFLRFNGKFFGLHGDKLEEKIDELLKKVGLNGASDKYLHEYSKGMLQRIGLAQSIINNPKLLFLDEPMSGLDPIGRKMVKDLLVELKKSGTTIFFNTHILADVESICDKFSIINKGNIIVQNKEVKSLTKHLEDFFIEEIEKNS
ncbi:MAG: ABC transporter ATP-binding protein [Candidatus Gracilibacteria bacterium]|nr:ABC transporter ATP-binding protein [Candidatus Gracilibacteria bacterium]